MLRRELKFIGLAILTLGLVLGVTVSGLAQTVTDTPTSAAEPTPTLEPEESPLVTETGEPTETPTSLAEEVTPEPSESAEVAETPEVTATAIEETATVTATITSTEEMTVTEVVETPAIVAVETVEPVPKQVAEEAEGIQLTVYNRNLGLVKEIRTFALDEGENQVRWSAVPSRIEPASVHFTSLTDPEGTAVLEQNYEYDLVSTRKLLQKYVDQEIALTSKQGTVYTGTLLSGADDAILATGDGIKVIKLDQIQELSFPQLPEGLITKPSLVWLLSAGHTGEQRVRITYLTSGIGWRADYIALLAADDRSLSMTGWITLDNNSGTAYQGARLKLVAGDIHRAPQAGYMLEMVEKEADRSVAVPAVEERAFFEYHIYEVKRPVTVRDQQTKQIKFVSAPEVDVEKVLVYEASPPFYARYGGAITEPGYGARTDQKVQVRLEFANKEESGLGLPLPQGTIRVYKEDIDGGAELVGEDSIDHTAKGEELSLYLGNAFDIVGERVQTKFRQIADRVIEESYQITLRNHKTEDATVRIIEHLFRAKDAEIVTSSAAYETLDANTIQYEMAVKADGEAKVEYTVRYTW